MRKSLTETTTQKRKTSVRWSTSRVQLQSISNQPSTRLRRAAKTRHKMASTHDKLTLLITTLFATLPRNSLKLNKGQPSCACRSVQLPLSRRMRRSCVITHNVSLQVRTDASDDVMTTVTTAATRGCGGENKLVSTNSEGFTSYRTLLALVNATCKT